MREKLTKKTIDYGKWSSAMTILLFVWIFVWILSVIISYLAKFPEIISNSIYVLCYFCSMASSFLSVRFEQKDSQKEEETWKKLFFFALECVCICSFFHFAYFCFKTKIPKIISLILKFFSMFFGLLFGITIPLIFYSGVRDMEQS